MSAMNVLWVLALAVVTSIATTVATGSLVVPRLDARKRRIQLAHTARDTFNASLLTIISACGRLENMPLPAPGDPECTAVMRVRLTSERARWVNQLDEATVWLIDNVETYAASWPLEQLRHTLPCAPSTRGWS